MKKYIIIVALIMAATAFAQHYWMQVDSDTQHATTGINRIIFSNENGADKIKIEPKTGGTISYSITPCLTTLTLGYTPTEEEDAALIEMRLQTLADGMGSDKVYRNCADYYFHANTDVERNKSVMVNTSTNGMNGAGLAFYDVNSSDVSIGLNEVWIGIYQNIDECNKIIADVLAMTPAPTNNTRTGALLAEVYTMRAFYYNDLITWWGDVPAFFTPLTGEPNYSYLAPVMKRELIYDQILADLLTAQSYLTDANKPRGVLHPSREAIQAFRARVALAAAGYALRSINQLSDYDIRPGSDSQNATAFVGRVKAAKRATYLQIAKDETKKVITKYGASKLPASFQDVFLAISRGEEADNKTESLWEMRYRNQFVKGWGLRHAADAYTGRATGDRGYVTGSLWYDYDAADTRRDVSIAPWYWTGSTGSEQITPSKINELCFAKLRPEWAAGNPDMKPDATGDAYRGRVVVRYADVLLMYAETCMELNTDVADGLEKLNWVRRRAYGASINAANASVDKTSLTLQTIIDERKFEFVGEQIRKRDLIRWGKLKEAMDTEINKCVDLQAWRNATADGTTPVSYTYNYSDVPVRVWYRMSPDKKDPVITTQPIIEFYGMNRGEFTEPGTGWISTSMWSASSLAGASAFYEQCFYSSSVNPDLRSLLPISNIVIGNSGGALSNVYGY